MTGYPGGFTAWAPAVVTVVVCSWVAYRGQVGTACLVVVVVVVFVGVVVVNIFPCLRPLVPWPLRPGSGDGGGAAAVFECWRLRCL